MKTHLKIIVAGLSMMSACLASAAPVEYDTPDAHIVVIRPMDQWVPATSAVADLDAKRFSGAYSGSYFLDQKKSIRLDDSGDQFSQYFANKYPKKKYDSANSIFTTVLRPITLKPENMPEVFNQLNEGYEAFIIANRKPAPPPSGGGGRPFGAIADGLSGAGVFGMIGAGVFGLLGAVLDNPIKINTTPLPVSKPANIDYSKFKSIDLRPTLSGAPARGQIIIAYKADKTEAIENEALAIGIGSTLGFDTTKEAVLVARAADLADRQVIWDKCVADGKCKDE